VPSELLRQRPDIRAAERRVAAANADIGVATAAFYPSFTHQRLHRLRHHPIGDLFQRVVAGLVHRRQRHDAAHQPEMLRPAPMPPSPPTMPPAPITARPCSNRHPRGGKRAPGTTILERRQVAQDQALEAARKTFDLSAKRYKSGLVSFLDVVDAERTRLDAERAANAIRAERLAVSVSLIKAIGGEW
jgi:outer membrane protein, multidrug efflux system